MSEDLAPHSGNWYVLIYGLPRLKTAVNLSSGLSLRPLEIPLDVFDLAALGAVGFREWAALEPLIKGCTAEIESAKDSEALPGPDALGRVWLLMAMLMLRGFTSAVGLAASAYSWRTIPIPNTGNDWNPSMRKVTSRRARADLPPFKGGVLDFHLKWLRLSNPRSQELEESDVSWINMRFPSANNLYTDSEKFRFVLQAACDWRFSEDGRIALARIWSGIEAIFGINSELIYRLSISCASLLELRGEARKKRFHDVKHLYAVRSKAVHGEEVAQETLDKAVQESFGLLRDLIALMINRGNILSQETLDEAVFG